MEPKVETVKYVGQIPVFPLAEYNPNESGDCKDSENMYIVYRSDGEYFPCVWNADCFWTFHGNTFEVVIDVEFWFRVPKVEEIVHG